MDMALRGCVVDALNEVVAEVAGGMVDDGAEIMIGLLERQGITFCRIPLTPQQAIESNMVLVAAQAPGPDDHVLETEDDASAFNDLGKMPVIAPYKPPRDPRVKELLMEAQRNRAAEQPATTPREIFTDPRLRPNYKPRR